MELKKVGPWSVARVLGTMNAAMGLIFGALFACVALVGGSVAQRNSDAGAFGALFGVGANRRRGPTAARSAAAGRGGSAKATEPSRRRSCIVPIPHSLRNDKGTRFALTKAISKPSHLVLERVDAFADAAVARCR
jgi:hypothetical protein